MNRANRAIGAIIFGFFNCFPPLKFQKPLLSTRVRVSATEHTKANLSMAGVVPTEDASINFMVTHYAVSVDRPRPSFSRLVSLFWINVLHE